MSRMPVSASSSAPRAREAPNRSAQQPRGALADLRDAERVDQPVERRVPASPGSRHQVVRRLLPHALELGELLDGEPDRGRTRRDHTALDQLRHQLLAQAVDVERVLGGEVAHTSRRCAGHCVDAAVGRRALLAASPRCRTTGSRGISKRPLAAVRRRRDDLDDVGMTSPARSISTRSPMRTSLRAISSMLCSEALEMVTPPTAPARARRPA
jgi:hypothetical protein